MVKVPWVEFRAIWKPKRRKKGYMLILTSVHISVYFLPSEKLAVPVSLWQTETRGNFIPQHPIIERIM